MIRGGNAVKTSFIQQLMDFMKSSSNLDHLLPVGIMILRVCVGIGVLLGHGLPKLQEMLGGNTDLALAIEQRLGFPYPNFFAWLVVVIQVFVSLLLILGLWTRPSAILIGFTIAYGVLNFHWVDGYYRMEAGLLYSLVFVIIAISGPGRVSIDRLIRGKQ